LQFLTETGHSTSEVVSTEIPSTINEFSIEMKLELGE